MQGGELLRKPRIPWLLVIAVALLTVLAAACEEEDKGEVTPAAETPAVETPAAETPAASPEAVTEEVPGVTDTEILLGTHQPLTGVASSYSQIAKVTKAYFDYINDTEGGVYGRKITLLIEDDQYSPPLTADVVRKLVEQDKVFAILNGLGEATHLQVVDYLRDQGVPDMYVSTGAVEWVKDPEARPNVFGAIYNYVGEGTVTGMYIAEHFPGKKLGYIGQNDAFGFDGFDGVKRGVGDALEVLPMETFEPTDPDVNSQVDRLHSAGAEVLAIWGIPTHTGTAIRHARTDLGWDVPIFISQTSTNELTLALGGAENSEGIIGPLGLRQAYETDDPAVQKHIEIIKKYGGLDTPNYLTFYGQYIGEIMVLTLEKAGPDLTREGLIEGAESIKDWRCSVCLRPGSMSETDHDPAQGLVLGRVELAPEDAVGARWVTFGDAYNWQGINPDDITPDQIVIEPYSD